MTPEARREADCEVVAIIERMGDDDAAFRVIGARVDSMWLLGSDEGQRLVERVNARRDRERRQAVQA